MGGVTRVEEGESERGRACIPTLNKLGRKYHHRLMYARNWPTPVYVLTSLWVELCDPCSIQKLDDSYVVFWADQ